LPHDGFRPCGCPRCAALTSASGVKGEEHSRLVWDYVARCAAQVPETKVTCLAYGSYARPYPGMQKLPSNVVVGFCAFSHPASLYYKDTFDQYQDAVRGWADLAHGKLACWQHYLASNRDEENVGMPEHTPEMYARAVRVMAKYGNHAFCEMMADSIMFELFNRYLLLKLFYDPTLDERELFRDYILTFYGPDAGPVIGAIYADINAKCIERFRNKYWKLLDDELLAEACYRKCISDFGGGWPGLQARVNLGELLLSQARQDAALQCLTGAPGVGGSWKAALLIGAAKVHIAAGHKPEAIAALKQALDTAGLHASQKKECESLLAGLK
jgi:tetratricopeptide (TPR) repeat protein